MIAPSRTNALPSSRIALTIARCGSSHLNLPLVGEFLNWGNRDMANQLRHAYGACLAIINSQRLRSQALTHLQNIRPAQPEEPPVAPAETETEAVPQLA